jgi:hypothetical protein
MIAMRLVALALILALSAVQEKKIPVPDSNAARQKYDLGMAKLGKRDTEGGIKTLEEAVKLDPGHVKAHEALARTYFAQKDRTKAHEHVWALSVIGGALSAEMQKILNDTQNQILCGLRWLVRHQAADGRWSAEGFGTTCRGGGKCDGKGEAESDVRTTSVAVLALQGSSFAPPSRETFDEKNFGTACKNALMWLIHEQKPDGGVGDPASPRSLEDHALATLVLVDMFGYTQLPWLKDPAQKGIDYLEAQRIPDKGWGAKPKARDADPTVTGWALLALRSARLGGTKVPEGSFVGEFKSASDASLFGPALTAVSGKEDLRKDLAPIIQKIAAEETPEDPKSRDALKIFLSEVVLKGGDPGGAWKTWSDSATRRLAKNQRYDGNGYACIDGSWDAVGTADGPRGRVLVTALNLLTLEMHHDFVGLFCAPPPPAPPKK